MDHAMIGKRGGVIIQHHNELRDLEAELLYIAFYGVETKPDITGEELNRGGHNPPYAAEYSC